MPSDEKVREVSVSFRLRGDPRGEAFGAEGSRLDDRRAGDSWHFDHVHKPSSTNGELFETSVQPSVASVCRGTGGIVLAGGVAEVGRTLMSKGEDDGVVGLAVQQIFDEIGTQRSRRYMLHVSYVEMTSTRMWDLLSGGREVKLDDRHRAKDISRRVVRSGPEDISDYLHEGNQCRSRANLAKDLAVGSHSVFMIDMEFRSSGDTKTQKSTLTLVDLAGLDSVSLAEVCGREAPRRNLSLLGRSLRHLSGPLWALLRRPLEAAATVALICSISTSRRGYASSRRVVDAAAMWVTQGEEELTTEQVNIRELERQIQALQAELSASVPRTEADAMMAQIKSLERQMEDLREAYAAAVKRAEEAERQLEDASHKLEEYRRAEAEARPAPEPMPVTPAKEPRPRRTRAVPKSEMAWQDLIGLNPPPAKRRKRSEQESKPERVPRAGGAKSQAEAPVESFEFQHGPDPAEKRTEGVPVLRAEGALPRTHPSAEERMEALLAESARSGIPGKASTVTPEASYKHPKAGTGGPPAPPLLALPPPPGLSPGGSPTPPDPSPPRRRRRRVSSELSVEAAKAVAEAEEHQAKIQKLQQDLAKRRQEMQLKHAAPSRRTEVQEDLPFETPPPAPKPFQQVPVPKVLPKPEVEGTTHKGLAARAPGPSESEVALSELRERLRQRGEAVAAAKKQMQAAAARLSGGVRAAAPAQEPAEEFGTPPPPPRRDPSPMEEESAPITPPPKRAGLQAQFWSPREGTPAASQGEGSVSSASRSPLRRAPDDKVEERPATEVPTEDVDNREGEFAESEDEAEMEEEEESQRKADPRSRQAEGGHRSAHAPRGRREEPPRTKGRDADARRGRSTSRRTEADSDAAPHTRRSERHREARTEPPPPRSWTRPSPRLRANPARSAFASRRPSALGVTSRFRPGMGQVPSRSDKDNCRQM